MVAPDTRRWLLTVARTALRDAIHRELGVQGLEVASAPRPDDPALEGPARMFVSWHDGPALIGCIGTLEPAEHLEEGVRHYAVVAGLHDRRTPPPDPARWAAMDCEISILGEPRLLPATGIDAIAPLLVPGRDGVILGHGDRRAFYLPVVWDKLSDPTEFLRALCRKANIDPDREGDAVVAYTLGVEAFGEHATQP